MVCAGGENGGYTIRKKSAELKQHLRFSGTTTQMLHLKFSGLWRPMLHGRINIDT